MDLFFCEKDKLLIFIVGLFVECWLVCGFKLNYLEVVVLIFVVLLEGVCDGCSVVELMYYGIILLNCEQVMEGVLEMILDIQVEVIFFDGIKLVIVYQFIV